MARDTRSGMQHTCSWMTSPYSGWDATLPLHANCFLNALTRRFWSYSGEMPCTVVSVLRPLRCWILRGGTRAVAGRKRALVPGREGESEKGGGVCYRENEKTI